MTHSTCDLYDEHGDTLQVLPAELQCFGGRTRFSGTAVTVKCFEDNSRIKELGVTPGKGRVLVVDGGGSRRCALLGDMIAQDFIDQQWEGVILYGLIRDRQELSGMDLGVKALGSIPRKSTRRGEGQTDLPIQIAGARIQPGDQVFADEDGVVVMPATR